jgi:uncharacterized membrane protein YciS (DUF1049 family)
MSVWLVGVSALAIWFVVGFVIGWVVGAIMGERRGIADTERRWSEAVGRADEARRR